MKSLFRILCLLVIGWNLGASAPPLIAPTEPLTPEEQQAKFKLPPGFEIQLVASEPNIQKPINLNFDAQGRLWVSNTVEYPVPAKKEAKARDALTILSEFGKDGRANKFQRFAERLNIPIGVVPLSEKEALAWSIPNIYRYTDTDGDGVADERKVAFGPFGVADTHGNQNAFTPWVDGWIYANHGYSNDSRVRIGGEGNAAIRLRSGNTYRMRADGTAIEQFCYGQVNPFGLSFDPLGNLFSADCHSRATTMLLRDGYYRSFGKPHDGLGFAPDTTALDHGGTGISGIVYGTSPQFPAEFRDVLFIGNVITNRVHCDRLEWKGSSPTVITVEDFLTCEDPWFRPVDVQQGPDGALYVADFYNCIIGHYEVRFNHPKRDRTRGRIWRIVYRGEAGKSKDPIASLPPDLTKLSFEDLFALLGDLNLTNRVAATEYLLAHFRAKALERARELWRGDKQSTTAAADSVAQRAHAIWLVQRSDTVDVDLAKRWTTDPDRLVRVHGVKALAAIPDWQSWHFEFVRERLADDDPFVRRAAAEALGQHSSSQSFTCLFTALDAADAEDVQLAHALKISIRNQLRDPDVARSLATLSWRPNDKEKLLTTIGGAVTGPAAVFLFDEAMASDQFDAILVKALPAVARTIEAERIPELLAKIQRKFAQDRTFQISLLRNIYLGLAQRGVPAPPELADALSALLKPIIQGTTDDLWRNEPYADSAVTTSPWGLEAHRYRDPTLDVPMMSSRHGGKSGERLTGVLRSPKFVVPQELSFWMGGYVGLDRENPKNFVRLVLEDGTEVTRTLPRNSDSAARVVWKLAEFAGKVARLEVVDGASDPQDAWIAVSHFSPPILHVPDQTVGDITAVHAEHVRLAGQLKLRSLTDDIASVAAESKGSALLELAALEALVSLSPSLAKSRLIELTKDGLQSVTVRQNAVRLLAQVNDKEAIDVLAEQLRFAPGSVAVEIASALASRSETGIRLIDEIRAGRASVTLLKEAAVLGGLQACGIDGLDRLVAELTANLSADDDRVTKLIKTRKKNYLAKAYDPHAGEAIFARSVCANCHKIGEVGKSLGPSLDGIGSRGLDRLLEDTLDPNKNVDQSFRTIMIEKEDGQIVSGFNLRDDGETFVLSDSKGEEIRLSESEIVNRKQSSLSPMPANVIEQIPEEDFYHLLAYLLSRQSQKASSSGEVGERATGSLD